MKKWQSFLLTGLLAMFLVGCGGGDDKVIPEPEQPSDSEKPVEPEKPINPKEIYNGIVLPDQWPPKRSYSSDIRKGMSPFYLSDKPDVINISVGRQLFVDDFLIEKTTLKRSFYYPEYHSANPVLQPDKEWEQSFAAPFSDGVWYDETDAKFKMWYMAGNSSTCYAESTDGISWTKPSLTVQSGTNIVDKGAQRDGSVVWIDKQESNASKRYKMFQVAGGKGNWKYHYKTSADGKVWRDNSTPSKAVADRSTVYKNPFRNVWSWSMRHNVRVKSSDPYTVRARDYYEHADPAVGNQNVVADLKYFWFGPWANEQKHPVYNNNDGSPGIYNLDGMPYESIMLGFFSVWQGPENDVCVADNVIKRNQIMVGYSRDGYHWFREDMNPFLPVDESSAANWNFGNLQSAVGSPLIVGDKLYFYLSGRRLNGAKEVTATGLATLRRDGFASMKGTGELQTPALKFTGEHFFVNVKVTGKLQVELLNADGTVVDGFSKDDCKAISGDNVKQKVEWNGQTSLKSLQGKNIKVKFYMEDGEIFAFWISPDNTGESQGYTAGGGPGLHTSGIEKKIKK